MKNFFELFEIEEKFQIDLDLLEEKYLNFQRNFHPDKAGIAEIEKSILFNEGYDILNDDFRRAAHILKLHGIDIEDDGKAPKVDQNTLMEIFSLQEEPQKIDKNEIKEKIKSLFTNTQNYLENGDFEKAAQDLMKVKYYRTILK
jgi:molecular chaperone HscB